MGNWSDWYGPTGPFAGFNNLRVWKDANGDGLTLEYALYTMEAGRNYE